jgi:hypothetical protein
MAIKRESKDHRQAPTTTPRKSGNKPCGCTEKGYSSKYDEEEESSKRSCSASYLNQGHSEDEDDDDDEEEDFDDEDEDEDYDDEDDDDYDDEEEEEDRGERFSRKGTIPQAQHNRPSPSKKK